ncbi:hypothetical protein SAY86_017462 [Trapa natans]|uniref:ACB domain-containing protein n=1 Tax=Trapa natans TaxID=22666 RepID=A0AAN7R8V4_TRANT|nr:hypothetical protein SAY86_017462 [Trapa natans]
MADWQQLLQSILLGLIFSYLLAKLISVLTSFKDDNLSIARASSSPAASSRLLSPRPEQLTAVAEVQDSCADADSLVAEHGSVRNESVVGTEDGRGSDSDWEGVETTELEEAFSAATTFVATAAADRLSHRVSNDAQLQLYALYKIATEGPCSSPQPSALKMTARAKWQAWNKLGVMPPEDAMQKYIDIVTELYPTWAAGSSAKSKGRDGDASSADAKGPMGPVFSTFVHEETVDELKMDAIHAFAREGEVANLAKCIDGGVNINVKDSEGRTSLHWAVDRGHFDVVELLISKGADVNAKDNEGQVPLHYAAVCEREGIGEFLVKNNASIAIKDNDGLSPSDICESDWPFMKSAEEKGTATATD